MENPALQVLRALMGHVVNQANQVDQVRMGGKEKQWSDHRVYLDYPEKMENPELPAFPAKMVYQAKMQF